MSSETKVQLEKGEQPTLTLIGTPPPKWATNILASIMIISFLLPALALVIVISLGSGPKLGLFVVMFIFGAIGYFLYRALHWNYSGKETLVFTNQTISYQASSKKFKMESREIDRKECKFEIVPHPDPIKVDGAKVEAANLTLISDKETFELKIRVPLEELKHLEPELEKLLL